MSKYYKTVYIYKKRILKEKNQSTNLYGMSGTRKQIQVDIKEDQEIIKIKIQPKDQVGLN